MKKLFSLLCLAAASLGALLTCGGCGRSDDSDCIDGGVTRRHSYDAPKVIHSTEIVALDTYFFLLEWEEGGCSNGGQRWSFEVSRDGESFLLAEQKRGRTTRSITVGRAFLREVHEVILKHDLARLNGFDEVTSGLPYQYAPCSLSVDYANGERLYFCMDGDPRAAWASDLKELFLRALSDAMQTEAKTSPTVPEDSELLEAPPAPE